MSPAERMLPKLYTVDIRVVYLPKNVFCCLKGRGPLKKIKIVRNVEFLNAYRLIPLTSPLPGNFNVQGGTGGEMVGALSQ